MERRWDPFGGSPPPGRAGLLRAMALRSEKHLNTTDKRYTKPKLHLQLTGL